MFFIHGSQGFHFRRWFVQSYSALTEGFRPTGNAAGVLNRSDLVSDRKRTEMKSSRSTRLVFRRRELLAGTAMLLFSATSVRAATIAGQLPWLPNAGNPPSRATLGPWEFFTADEGRAMEALADCIIPPDPETPGGKDAGCAVFIDRQ